jgi:hypothetical protein
MTADGALPPLTGTEAKDPLPPEAVVAALKGASPGSRSLRAPTALGKPTIRDGAAPFPPPVGLRTGAWVGQGDSHLSLPKDIG